MFPVYDIREFISYRPENLGTKEKRWVVPPEEHHLPHRLHLFKLGREGSGENWSEKISCEIAKALGLPAAQYDFATHGEERGVLSERFLPDSAMLLPGNLLLSQIVDGYDSTKRFKQIEYKLSSVLGCIRLFNILSNPQNSCESIHHLAPHEVFIGYLVLDAFIGNTDRHHENWGFVVLGSNTDELKVHLAPTFDHASALGRSETAASLQMRLGTSDARATVEAYASRARSAFFGTAQPGRTMLLTEMLEELVAAYPVPTRFWAQRIVDLNHGLLESLFAEIGAEWISDDATAFALRMLEFNRTRIGEIARV